MKNFYPSVRNLLSRGQVRLQLSGMAVAFVMALLPVRLFAQAPAISYSTPQTYNAATAITPLSPANTGGAVPAFGYNTTATEIPTGVNDALSLAADKSGNIYIGEGGGNISLLPAGGGTATVFATGFADVYSVAVDASNNVYAADNAHVWKIPAGGGTPVTLGSFSSPVGLAFDAAGYLYVASNGGSNPGVYKMSTDGTGQTRIDNNLQGPAYIAFDTNGNLFIGDQPTGSLYEIPVGGSQTQLASGLNPIVSVKTDLSGNVYISDSAAGINCYSPAAGLFQIDSNPAYGLMTDANFNLYYTSSGGIYEISPNGGYFTNPELPQGLVINQSSGVISGTPAGVSAATNYTVTAFNAIGSGSATINIVINPTLPTISYTSPHSYQVGSAISALSPSSTNVTSWGYSTSTTAVSAGFGAPVDVAADAAGNVYVADFSMNQVEKIPAGGGAPVVFSSGFNQPFGVAADAAGNVYVADAGNNAVKEILAGSGAVNAIGSGFNGPSAVAVDGSGNVYVGDTGNGALKEIPAGNGTPVTLQSGFASIQGVAVDAAGNVYVADAGTSGNGAVYKIPAGGGSMVSVGTGFSRPGGVAVDAAGNLYVSDVNNTVITVIEPGGTQFTIGSGFNHANGVTFDSGGNLYIADSGNALVKEVKINGGYFLSPLLPAGLTFNNSTGVISGTPATPAPTATYTVTGYNGASSSWATISITVGAPIISYTSPVAYAAGAAITPLSPTSTGGAVPALSFSSSATTLSTGLNDATCLAMDKSGNIYIGESSGKVSKLAAGGTSATIFASGFGSVTGIAVDASNNVFFADGASIWKIPAGGTAVTLGSFSRATAVALDAAGNIYVAANGDGIYKIAGDGSGQTKISNLDALSVTVDANGNLFAGDGLQSLYEIPVGGVQKSITSFFTPVAATTSDAAGNVYIGLGTNGGLQFLPAGEGSTSVIGPLFSGIVTGVIVDPNFNLYVANNGIITKISAAGGYFISPELPNGLTINPNSGAISGTPATAAASTTANYTVTAFNTSASATATVNLTVAPAPAISYSTPQIYTAGQPIAPLQPVSTGGVVSAPGFNTITETLNTGITDATCTAMDNNGNLYIGEWSGKISVLAAGSTTATVFATGFSPDGYHDAEGIAVDRSGNVYFADKQWLWKIPAGGGTPVKLSGFEEVEQVSTDAAGNIYVCVAAQGIYKMASDGTNITQIVIGVFYGMTADQNGNVFFSSRGSQNKTFEIPAGGVQKTVNPNGSTIHTTDASGNIYMVNGDGTIGMIPANGTIESQVEPTITGISNIMIGADFNLYAIVSGRIIKAGPAGGYFTSPELPLGLAIDPTSGAISGTPAAASPATNYTVTAFSNSVGAAATVNIKVNPALSTDATLSNLTLNAGLLTPSFTPGDTAYMRNLVNGVQAVTIVPTTNDPNATILINGTTSLASGATSNPLPVSVGTNTITIKVTAQDGVTTETYTLTLVRAGARNDLLTSLKPSRGVLSPAFAGTTTNYTASVTGGVTSMTVTPTAADPNATIVVNGTDVVASGTASDPITLLPGQNTITTTVTAQNDTATRTYTLTVTREVSKNDLLSALKLSAGVKNPVFQSNVLNYAANVVNGVSSITVTATASDADATLRLDGGQAPLISGVTSVPIPLAVGPNTITVKVTAPDGVTNQTYTVIVTRAAAPAATDAYQPVSVEKPNETPALNDDGIVVHQAISPNGDGINDFLQIDNISQYPDNKIFIMNRNGQLIYEAKGYDNSSKVFDGHSNKTGQMQLPGTYFYQLDYTVSGITKHKTGFLILKY